MSDFAALSSADRDLILGCDGVRDHPAGTVILHEGEASQSLWFVSGWACRLRVLPDGRRQIINFILAGDSVGMHTHRGASTSCAVVSLTPVRTVDGSPVTAALGDPAHLGLSQALHHQQAAETAFLYDQIERLGRRTAFERVSHLLNELNERLRRVGLADGNQFELPLTQEILAEAVGLSIVHVNRTLQQMRRAGVVELRGGHVKVLDPALDGEAGEPADMSAA